MQFNPALPTIMHVDLNSCFATIEQQANLLFRGKPLVVAAYVQNNGCILAASREAKVLGIKTGMRVGEGLEIYRKLIILPSDPEKYRFINHKLQDLLGEYSCNMSVESIDEMVVDFKSSPVLFTKLKQFSSFYPTYEEDCSSAILLNCWEKEKKEIPLSNITMQQYNNSFHSKRVAGVMTSIGQEIKQRIKDEIGEWLTVSIGISTNRYLAKVASGFHKPDGLDDLTKENIEEKFKDMELEDLCGIKHGIASRLRYAHINTPVELYHAKAEELYRALHSIVGYQWWYRLHGYDLSAGKAGDGSCYKAFGSGVEEVASASGSGEPQQKTFGQSYALGTPFTPRENGLYQVLSQLVSKMARRLRQADCTASGVYVSCLYTDHTHWGHGQKIPGVVSLDADFYQRMCHVLREAPPNPVRILAIGCFNLTHQIHQESLLEDVQKREWITKAIDAIADRWGDGTVVSARILGTRQKVLDRIAFGRVRELHDIKK